MVICDFGPIIIPLEDVVDGKKNVFNYVWPKPKGEQPPTEYIPNTKTYIPDMSVPPPYFPTNGGNKTNCNTVPSNAMGAGSSMNTTYTHPNRMMVYNQLYSGDQLTQQYHAQNKTQQSVHQDLPRLFMKPDQQWYQKQPPDVNGRLLPLQYRGRGGRHINDLKSSNYDFCRGKMYDYNYRGNRNAPYSRTYDSG